VISSSSSVVVVVVEIVDGDKGMILMIDIFEKRTLRCEILLSSGLHTGVIDVVSGSVSASALAAFIAFNSSFVANTTAEQYEKAPINIYSILMIRCLLFVAYGDAICDLLVTG
jgi:hypothetical protein